jgi:hypothetical protein
LTKDEKMLFKQVTPFPCFTSKGPNTVEGVNVFTVEDNWRDHMKLRYTLADANGNFCGDGLITFDGSKYPTDVADDTTIYTLVCQAIGLELVNARSYVGEVA